ncbi:Kelch domain-containing protein 2 [Entomortierella chlamydospora]|uniref:Kelch domain-containing protein 2 n=1 Tax=Entomortierella chlamydospora TaxID=101097 RepID=A0A9P6N2Y0_9FUNG|nr:Kelch domain-containing protein 2 [Entomortierella chlamydospora]
MVYDTTAGTWSVQTATGATPPLRRNHVAAANSNGQIYIHGGTDLDATTFFADVAILDTTSWQWSQPAIEGNAPTGRYSHAATMVGSNMIITFGLTAGDSTNNIFILDTTSNTWQTSYTPNNLAQTSTNPKDWPGYKPPPVSPTTPSTGTGTPQPQPDVKKSSSIAPIVGGIFGIVTLTAIAVIVVKRHRRRQIIDQQAKFSNLYQSDYANQRQYRLEEAYAPTGMAFDSAPASFGQRMEQLWGNMGAVAFWRGDRRAANRSQSHRLEDQEEDEGMRGLHVGPITDQDIFLDAVHRARSRSPRSPILVSAGIGGPQRYSGVTEYEEIDESTGEHVRSYSDGFENSMQEMDVQMVAVPKGRLYVVNPSDETITQEQNLTK